MMRTLCVDIGGSGTKVIVVDENGKPLSERARVETPRPATPESIINAIAELSKSQGRFERVSVGFPGVVKDGVIHTAQNLDASWIGFNIHDGIGKALRKPVRAANDADVQGMAVISGRGLELVITLGTGLGSALFVQGNLAPNLELAHHPFQKNRTYEERLGDHALQKVGAKKWNRRVQEMLVQLEALFNYDHLYLGGGNAKKLEGPFRENVSVVSNIAGLLGGAWLWRSEDPPPPLR